MTTERIRRLECQIRTLEQAAARHGRLSIMAMNKARYIRPPATRTKPRRKLNFRSRRLDEIEELWDARAGLFATEAFRFAGLLLDARTTLESLRRESNETLVEIQPVTFPAALA